MQQTETIFTIQLHGEKNKIQKNHDTRTKYCSHYAPKVEFGHLPLQWWFSQCLGTFAEWNFAAPRSCRHRAGSIEASTLIWNRHSNLHWISESILQLQLHLSDHIYIYIYIHTHWRYRQYKSMNKSARSHNCLYSGCTENEILQNTPPHKKNLPPKPTTIVTPPPPPNPPQNYDTMNRNITNRFSSSPPKKHIAFHCKDWKSRQQIASLMFWLFVCFSTEDTERMTNHCPPHQTAHHHHPHHHQSRRPAWAWACSWRTFWRPDCLLPLPRFPCRDLSADLHAAQQYLVTTTKYHLWIDTFVLTVHWHPFDTSMHWLYIISTPIPLCTDCALIPQHTDCTVITLCTDCTVITLCSDTLIPLCTDCTVITLCTDCTVITLCTDCTVIPLCSDTLIPLCTDCTVIPLCSDTLIPLCTDCTVIPLCTDCTVIPLCSDTLIPLCTDRTFIPQHTMHWYWYLTPLTTLIPHCTDYTSILIPHSTDYTDTSMYWLYINTDASLYWLCIDTSIHWLYTDNDTSLHWLYTETSIQTVHWYLNHWLYTDTDTSLHWLYVDNSTHWLRIGTPVSKGLLFYK